MKKQSIEILSKIALFLAVFVLTIFVSLVYLEPYYAKISDINKFQAITYPSYITDNLTLLRSDTECNVEHGNCILDFSLRGEIAMSDANALETYLLAKSHQRKHLVPVLFVDSSGGNINAAMNIGRVLRKYEGSASSEHSKCYSACILIMAGAVNRFWDELGIHRPYFSALQSDLPLPEIDKRYKTMMSDIKLYLHEMNISDELADVMQSVPPDKLKFLSYEEELKYGLSWEDPAHQERMTAVFASVAGLTSAEFREKVALISTYCQSKFIEGHSKNQCISTLENNIIWTLNQRKIKGGNLEQLFHKLDTICTNQPRNDNWRSCVTDQISNYNK